MSERFVNVDRETAMLLPVDLQQWVPEDDLVHFVINAVETMRLPSLKVNQRGSGSEQYPPQMMLALVVYCYANGVMSSRRIERATYRDIAVRPSAVTPIRIMIRSVPSVATMGRRSRKRSWRFCA